MPKYKSIIISFILVLSTAPAGWGQNSGFTVNGNVSDASNGEALSGVNIYIINGNGGTVTNEYGFYSLFLPEGMHKIAVSYVGYRTDTLSVSRHNTRLNIVLRPVSTHLNEVSINAEQRDINISRSETSVERLTAALVKTVPAMLGEVDVIKVIQMLPGVQAVAEGSTNFSVRGGSFDQNLILLDEATVYSASHLLGFFSVFNNDVVRDVKLYKGDIPASFGGRLASLTDVRTKEGNNQKFAATGGIGTIASRVLVEAPLFSDRASFLVAGRRTYADLFLRASGNEELKNTALYFYDMNVKVNYRINDNNRIYVSGYFGRDYFAMKPVATMGFGNRTVTVRWNSILSPRLFANFSFTGSYYDYHLGSEMTPEIAQSWDSKLTDYGGKMDFTFSVNKTNKMKFGYQIVHHTINPGKGGGTAAASVIQTYELPSLFALEHALYVSNEMSFDKLMLRYGVRYAFFHNIGNGKEAVIMDGYQITSRQIMPAGQIYNTHHGLEPRMGVSYKFNNQNALKASYSRAAQYIQLASNSSAGSPLDLWFPASPNIKPQLSNQFVVGYFRNFKDNMFETSLEVYYKHLTNVVDFKDRAVIFGNPALDTELRFGKGYAYGVELMVRKNGGKLNGWISYAFSRSMRKIDEINNNEWYRSTYDRPHSVSIAVNYNFAERWSASANWIYATGRPVTYPEGRYLIGESYVPVPSARNAYRFPDYHRLDLSLTWKLSPADRRFQNELNLSVYNAYARKNPWTIYFTQEEQNPSRSYAEMIYLFSIVPAVTWNFYF
ncbi:MAG: TonB-dependent receptor [Prevotellaceae bacterium]|nr:TonB-dependent receptor [Prevotellaceae bacterium]